MDPLQTSTNFPPPPTELQTRSPGELERFLRNLTNAVQNSVRRLEQAVNDDLLVKSDFIRLKDEDYTTLVSDHVVIFFPTANRVVTLPDPDRDDPPEQHPVTILHAGSANTVTINPEGSVTVDGVASVALAAGEARTMVPIRQRVVDRDGVGSVGWVTISTRP
jgi:hypothetical protein